MDSIGEEPFYCVGTAPMPLEALKKALKVFKLDLFLKIIRFLIYFTGHSVTSIKRFTLVYENRLNTLKRLGKFIVKVIIFHKRPRFYRYNLSTYR